MEIETVEDLKKALKDYGYSDKAATEILKWYNVDHSHNHCKSIEKKEIFSNFA